MCIIPIGEKKKEADKIPHLTSSLNFFCWNIKITLHNNKVFHNFSIFPVILLTKQPHKLLYHYKLKHTSRVYWQELFHRGKHLMYVHSQSTMGSFNTQFCIQWPRALGNSWWQHSWGESWHHSHGIHNKACLCTLHGILQQGYLWNESVVVFQYFYTQINLQS